MAFIDDFADWMNNTLTVTPIISKDTFGKPTYGTPVVLPCMVRRESERILNNQGNEVTTTGRAMVAYYGIDPVSVKLTLEAGAGPESILPKSIVIRVDENGVADYEVVYF